MSLTEFKTRCALLEILICAFVRPHTWASPLGLTSNDYVRFRPDASKRKFYRWKKREWKRQFRKHRRCEYIFCPFKSHKYGNSDSKYNRNVYRVHSLHCKFATQSQTPQFPLVFCISFKPCHPCKGIYY